MELGKEIGVIVSINTFRLIEKDLFVTNHKISLTVSTILNDIDRGNNVLKDKDIWI